MRRRRCTPGSGTSRQALCTTLSCGAEKPTRPEYVTVPVRPIRGMGKGANLKMSVAVSQWNQLWEAA